MARAVARARAVDAQRALSPRDMGRSRRTAAQTEARSRLRRCYRSRAVQNRAFRDGCGRGSLRLAAAPQSQADPRRDATAAMPAALQPPNDLQRIKARLQQGLVVRILAEILQSVRRVRRDIKLLRSRATVSFALRTSLSRATCNAAARSLEMPRYARPCPPPAELVSGHSARRPPRLVFKKRPNWLSDGE